MAVRDHLKPGISDRTRVKILTVDPGTRRVEAVIKDGAMIQIAVWDVHAIFRWPIEGEIWIVWRQNGIWMLGQRVQGNRKEGSGPTAVWNKEPLPLETMQPGQVKIDGDQIFTALGNLVMTTGVSQQSTSYTFVLEDAFTTVESSSATAVIFTIPSSVDVNFLPSTQIEVFQLGAGQVTIAAGTGVTLLSSGSAVHTASQYATIRLRQRAQDIWVLSGDLS